VTVSVTINLITNVMISHYIVTAIVITDTYSLITMVRLLVVKYNLATIVC